MSTDDGIVAGYAVTEPLSKSSYNKRFIASLVVIIAIMAAGVIALFLNWNELDDGAQTALMAIPILYVLFLPFGGLKVAEQIAVWIAMKSRNF